jgi:hypothetical protein
MEDETWAERMTDRLAALKLTRCTFDAAWSIALLENPVDWRRDFGIRGERYTATLDGMLEEQSTLRWLEGVFRAAWENDPASAKLRHLEPVVGLLSPARRVDARERSREALAA